MQTKSILMLSALCCATLFSACNSSQDVPVPQDQMAENVTPNIKESYPDWQPTKEAPKGNAEFEAMFQNDTAAPAPAAATATTEPVVTPGTEVQTPPTVADEALKAQYPFLFTTAPAVVRLDINVDGSILVDGKAYPIEIVEKYLGKVAADNGAASVAIIRPVSNITPMDKVNQSLDLCRKAKIASVRFVNPGKDYGTGKQNVPEKQPAAPKAKVKYVVDTNVPATEYVIQNGDSLGKISLKFYKDVRHVHFILDANPKVKANPNKIRSGMKISIPAIKVQE